MNVKSCFVGNEISFSYLGKDLIGFLDKRYISEGFVEYFTEITLYLLYSFLKRKQKKKRKTVASTKYRFTKNGIGNDRLNDFSVLFLEDGVLNIEYLSSYEVVFVFVKK